MQFINLTSHTINEITTGLAIPPSGRVARVKASTIKNLISKWRDVLADREEALDNWSGSSAVADELQAQIDIALEIISDLEGLLKEAGE